MSSGTNHSSTGTADGGAGPPSSPEAIEAAIVLRRAHLSDTLDELTDRLTPAHLARDAREQAVTRARGAVTDEQGNLLVERLVAVGAAVVAVVVAAVLLRRRSSRRSAGRSGRRSADASSRRSSR